MVWCKMQKSYAHIADVPSCFQSLSQTQQRSRIIQSVIQSTANVVFPWFLI